MILAEWYNEETRNHCSYNHPKIVVVMLLKPSPWAITPRLRQVPEGNVVTKIQFVVAVQQ